MLDKLHWMTTGCSEHPQTLIHEVQNENLIHTIVAKTFKLQNTQLQVPQISTVYVGPSAETGFEFSRAC